MIYFEGFNNSLHCPPFRELRKGARWGVEAELSEGVSEGLPEGLPEACVQMGDTYFLGGDFRESFGEGFGRALEEGFEGFWEGF